MLSLMETPKRLAPYAYLLKSGYFFLITFLLLSLTTTLQGQSVKGTWYGQFGEPFRYRIILHVDSTQNGYQMKTDFPDSGDLGMEASKFSFEYPYLRFEPFPSVGYQGVIDKEFSKISGWVTIRESQKNMCFTRDSIPPEECSLVALQTKYAKREITIPMRDGVKLFTSVYTPKDTSKSYPIVMTRTPYCSEPGGKDRFNFFLSVYFQFLRENYIMVFQDVRGKYMSEGEFEDIRPFNAAKNSDKDTDEASDTYDTVDWLVKNIAHNNGRVGVMGISYPGFYSTMALLSGHPAIKAVSPQAPVTAWFLGDDVHHNGAFFLVDNFGFDFSNGRIFKKPGRDGFPEFDFPINDSYQFFLGLGPLKNITAKYMGDSIQMWRDVMKHPNYDNFWRSRDPLRYLKNIGPAVMTVGGWFDAEDLYGALHTYSAIEKQNPHSHPNFLVMGPWSHGQWLGGEAEHLGNIYWGQNANKLFHELEMKFFDHYLLDKKEGELPEASVFVTGANEWRSFDAWPPANVTDRKIYLQPDGILSFLTPSVSESFDEYISDPMKPVPYTEKVNIHRTTEYMTDDQRFASRRPDVMVYQTDTLSQELTLTGPLVADLFVSTTGTDADYVVKLIDVFPQDMMAPDGKDLEIKLAGYQMLVRGEVIRGRFRNSFENPEPFKPGKVTEVKYEIPDIAHSFKKGHRIMIQVQNSWFPLVDRNPQKFVDIYQCGDEDFQKATHRIYHDKQHPSYIQIKTLN